MKNKTFCVLPWIHVASRTNGEVKPCCLSTRVIKKPDGSTYNLGYDTLEEIYNSDEFIDIRKKMVAGEPVSGCETCYRQEESSNFSNRLYYNKEFPSTILVNASIAQDYKININVKYMDLRFGNLCNLKCRTCTPANSSQLNKEIAELPKTATLSKIYPVVPDNLNEWYTTEMFFDNLDKTKKYLRVVYLTGGEPTLVEGNYRFMQMMIDEGSNKNIMLAFNTNLTNIQDKFLKYVNQFRKVMFSCSIDGIGPMQEYLRYPSNWAQIDKNFKKIIESTENGIIRMTPVIQITNLEFLPELFEYAENINREHKKPIIEIFPAILNHPSIMDIQYLPLDYKKYCWDKLSNWLKTAEYQTEKFYEKMKQVEHRCLIDVDYKQQLNEFKEMTELLDANRNQTLKDVNSNLYSIIFTK